MITVIKYGDLGRLDLDWLSARYHFSFANYSNPERMGFGMLRVVNDDTIQPHTGFGTHRHRNMEIVTIVCEGVVSHRDSFGHEGHLFAGSVQVMSAGSGIEHSEFNLQDCVARMYQIWIVPRERETEPRWDMVDIDACYGSGEQALHLLVSGVQGEAPLTINQDARIYVGRLVAGQRVSQSLVHQAYVLVSHGDVMFDGVVAKIGDGVEITDQSSVKIEAISDVDLVMIDVVA